MSTPHPDLLASGLIRTDWSGRIVWMNRAASALLACRARQAVDIPLERLSPSLARWDQRMRQLGRVLQVAEAPLDQSGVFVDAVLQPLDDHTLIELHPVTERIRQREMTERADRQQAMTLLARRLAHELRNPLAGVRGAAQLVAASDANPASVRHAEMIQREVDRITTLIDRLSGEAGRELEPVNLHLVLNESAELVIAEQAGRLRLKQHYDPSIPLLQSDSGQMHQLFLNLLRNAAQAGAETIRITTRIDHDSPLVHDPARHAVRIEIEDDGEGVPEALHDRLFLPLVSGRDQGTGFGLAVAQNIARGHQGLIEFEPLDEGSRFRVRLPLLVAKSGS